MGSYLTSTLCVLVVVPPERSDLVLTANIPHRETDVLVFHSLNIEPCKTAQSTTVKTPKYQQTTDAHNHKTPKTPSPTNYCHMWATITKES